MVTLQSKELLEDGTNRCCGIVDATAVPIHILSVPVCEGVRQSHAAVVVVAVVGLVVEIGSMDCLGRLDTRHIYWGKTRLVNYDIMLEVWFKER